MKTESQNILLQENPGCMASIMQDRYVYRQKTNYIEYLPSPTLETMPTNSSVQCNVGVKLSLVKIPSLQLWHNLQAELKSWIEEIWVWIVWRQAIAKYLSEFQLIKDRNKYFQGLITFKIVVLAYLFLLTLSWEWCC